MAINCYERRCTSRQSGREQHLFYRQAKRCQTRRHVWEEGLYREYRSANVMAERILGSQARADGSGHGGGEREMSIAPGLKMDQSKKLAGEVVTQLRRLAHDLSNSIETIMQASYLLSQTKLDANGKKWAGMIESAVQDAAQINQGLREILRSQGRAPGQRANVRRRAS